jgi:hypothetical protein
VPRRHQANALGLALPQSMHAVQQSKHSRPPQTNPSSGGGAAAPKKNRTSKANPSRWPGHSRQLSVNQPFLTPGYAGCLVLPLPLLLLLPPMPLLPPFSLPGSSPGGGRDDECDKECDESMLGKGWDGPAVVDFLCHKREATQQPRNTKERRME